MITVYSLGITEDGWSAKNRASGKELNGTFEDLPMEVAEVFRRVIFKKAQAVCWSGSVPLSNDSEFSRWFESTPACALVM